jgi:3-deoxy-D-manno-octulosonate 8-phosphate phosphatase KdsC-like HAD superfamily phosphatase
LFSLIENDQLPEQISVNENRPFTAKSEAREFIGKAETQITIVDNYIGIGTLDCLRDTDKAIRILTGSKSQNIEKNFQKSFTEFVSEGHVIEIRCHPKLHDRYIIFNDRCWLVGSSLKDAGKKSLNIIECIDIKNNIVTDVDKKWNEAASYQF